MNMIKCSCGADIPEATKFCGSCGAKIEPQVIQAVEPPPPVPVEPQVIQAVEPPPPAPVEPQVKYYLLSLKSSQNKINGLTNMSFYDKIQVMFKCKHYPKKFTGKGLDYEYD